MRADQIILSAKVSGVQDLIDVYRALARRCDYPLHLGLPKRGWAQRASWHPARRLGVLLQEGIGDTIRVSLTPAPGGDRTEEVRVATTDSAVAGHPQLYAASDRLSGLRPHHQHVFPGDGRADSDLLARADAPWKDRYGRGRDESGGHGLRGQRPRRVEARQYRYFSAGYFEEPKAPVYVDGRLFTTLKGDRSSRSSSKFSTSMLFRTTPRAKKKQLRFRSTFHFAISPRQEISFRTLLLPTHPSNASEGHPEARKGYCGRVQKQNDPGK